WGSGSAESEACARHRGGGTGAWSRELRDADVEALFGGGATLDAVERDGVRLTRVASAAGERLLPYDEVHRLLARRLGWDALPSPPDAYTRVGGGWLATGRGSGHRVGLCLAD